jgi:hypothetical protein
MNTENQAHGLGRIDANIEFSFKGENYAALIHAYQLGVES